MSKKEQMMVWCLEDLKNVEKLFKGNEKVIRKQRELTEYAINEYLQEKKTSNASFFVVIKGDD